MAELITPLITVTMADGSSWTVQTGNPDLVAWDLTASKHKWPGVKDAPFLWLTFLAWHASRRRGVLPEQGMSFETFRATAENVEGPDPDTEPGEGDGWAAVVPTVPGPAPG